MMTAPDLFIEKGAAFSPCRRWRYKLWRIWSEEERLLVVVGLNPSTADEAVDDPTSWRCIDFARRWDCGGLMLLNEFAFRATKPKDMLAADDPVGPGNKDAFDDVLGNLRGRPAPLVLCAWGAHGSHMDQDETVLGWLRDWPDITPMCLGLTKGGMPRHPLYMPKNATPTPYRGRNHGGN